MNWRQLGLSIDEFLVSIQDSANLFLHPKGIFPRTSDNGLALGRCFTLIMFNYEMKFAQQNFPNILSEETHSLYRFGTDLMLQLYKVGEWETSADDFYDWLISQDEKFL